MNASVNLQPLAIPTASAIARARETLYETIEPSPVIPLQNDRDARIFLKLECLFPIGSFKLRGALNALAQLHDDELDEGVCTASAGNMAQGVAWAAREREIPCRVIVPEQAPKAKTQSVERLGGEIVRLPFDDWWAILEGAQHPAIRGHFVHPVCDPHVIAGNATAGLEILEQVPSVSVILVPYGGGGLSCGIAAAISHHKPACRVFACEVSTAAPLAASLAAGALTAVTYTPSFVDGIGGKSVLEPMWPMARRLLAGSRVVSPADAAASVRLLALRHRVIAEGAGAVAVASAVSARDMDDETIVSVVSGGNIDVDKLVPILKGEDVS